MSHSNDTDSVAAVVVNRADAARLACPCDTFDCAAEGA